MLSDNSLSSSSSRTRTLTEEASHFTPPTPPHSYTPHAQLVLRRPCPKIEQRRQILLIISYPAAPPTSLHMSMINVYLEIRIALVYLAPSDDPNSVKYHPQTQSTILPYGSQDLPAFL